MGLIASISSATGGSGKSTTSLNLAVALAQLNKDVTLIDANISTPYLSMYLGAPNIPVTLHHVLKGHNHILEAVYKHESGAKIIPGSLSMKNIENLNLEHLKDHLKHIKSDITILDTAPGLDKEATDPIKMSDEVLVVTTPELPSVAHSLKTVRMVQSYGKAVTGIVMTRAGHDLDLKVKNVETILEHPVIGVIPEDKTIKQAMYRKQPVVHLYPNAPSSIAYRKLASYLTGVGIEEIKRMQEKENIGDTYKFMKWAFGMGR